jgi:hypothetical protein
MARQEAACAIGMPSCCEQANTAANGMSNEFTVRIRTYSQHNNSWKIYNPVTILQAEYLSLAGLEKLRSPSGSRPCGQRNPEYANSADIFVDVPTSANRVRWWQQRKRCNRAFPCRKLADHVAKLRQH